MLCKKRKRERREATVRKKERKEKTNSKKQIKRTTPFSALCFPVSRPLCLFLCFCSASDLTATLSKRTKRRIRRRKGVKHRSKLSLSFKSIRHAFSMPPTTMLLRLPFPAAQARPCLVRGKPVTRPRHVARAAPANGGSSSSVADRQEQAAPATERPSPASSPPPRPPHLLLLLRLPLLLLRRARSRLCHPTRLSRPSGRGGGALIKKRENEARGTNKVFLELLLSLTKKLHNFKKTHTQAPPPGLFCLAALDLHALRKLACRREGKREDRQSRKRRRRRRNKRQKRRFVLSHLKPTFLGEKINSTTTTTTTTTTHRPRPSPRRPATPWSATARSRCTSGRAPAAPALGRAARGRAAPSEPRGAEGARGLPSRRRTAPAWRAPGWATSGTRLRGWARRAGSTGGGGGGEERKPLLLLWAR